MDCSNLEPQIIACEDEVPEPDPSLVIVESFCGESFEITVEDDGTGTPGDPLTRIYTVTDDQGNVATCEQSFYGIGSTLAVTSIWPQECVLGNLTVNGNYTPCAPVTMSSISIQFWLDGVYTGVEFAPTINTNNLTWTFATTLSTLIDMGLEFGTGYDLYPFMTLSNGITVLGEELEFGFNNDVQLADQSDPQVTLNDNPDDPTTSMATFCAGTPIFYHGVDPLSNNHFSSISRRQIGGFGGFTDYESFGSNGWVGESLDGFVGNLEEQYPPSPEYPNGYFEAGFEYILQIASANTDDCITWSPVYLEFKVVDCCAPDWEIVSEPSCVVDGEEFTINVILDGPLTEEDIQIIYSYNNDYIFVDYEAIEHPDFLELEITFISNGCTCQGNMLIFDIGLVDCPTPVWIMTHEIPCCDSNCESLELEDWYADPECIMVNGNIAHEFCLEISNDVPIIDVFPQANDATCQVEVSNIEITDDGAGLYTICGYMSFLDPDCVGWTFISLILETENGCCSIEQGFSFPEGCDPEDPCLATDPEIQVVYPGYMTVSLDIPLNQAVTVINHVTGYQEVVLVSTISCGPFGQSPGGVITGGTDCNGIEVTSPMSLSCYPYGGETPYIPYHYELSWGECVWVLTGNYCDELIPALPFNDDDDAGARSDAPDLRLNPSNDEDLKIYPNPLVNSDEIMFDRNNMDQAIQEILIQNIDGKLIESFVPENQEGVFSHQLSRSLKSGVYIVVAKLEDGRTKSAKLIVL